MAIIKPFKGIRYNPENISFISRVITPPYDVISTAEEQKLIEKDQHNFIRLGLGKTPDAGRQNDEYLFISDIYHKWRQDGILIKDQKPSLYLLEQEFKTNGKKFKRRGFISALQLEELGENSIFPHESTMEGPKRDRIKLMETCNANLSQPILLHSDPERKIAETIAELCESPDFLYSFQDRNKIAHTVWRIDDQEYVESLSSLMESQSAVIADGHHRYESALHYSKTHRPEDAPSGSVPEDFMSVFLVSVEDEGLLSLPTHRGVKKGADIDLKVFLKELKKYFSISSVKIQNGDSVYSYYNKLRGEKPFLGCITPHGTLLLLQPKKIAELPLSENLDPDRLEELPVHLLHYFIFSKLLDIPPGSEAESSAVEYDSSAANIYWGVQSNEYELGFLLPPISPSLIEELAEEGKKVPIKSTFFYPKIPSGLVIYPFED